VQSDNTPAKIRVLIVDDDATTRKSVGRFLTALGYSIVECGDGRAARRELAACPAALAVVELINPGEEGLMTIIEFRRQYPSVVVIATCLGSAHAEFYLKIAVQLGARGALAKPYTAAALASVIDRVVRADQSAETPGAAVPNSKTASWPVRKL
jgi:DNA-binding response OmpR family regulator